MGSALTLLRYAGLVAAVIGIVWLLLVEVVLRKRMNGGVYHWSLLVGLLVLPAIAILSTLTMTVEKTKTVQFCASCHVMEPFIANMLNDKSDTLAARHHLNKWISRDQCYACHTTYGLHGAFVAKVGGFRHWVNYVIGGWEGPIQYRGTYPNSNCLTCHDATPKYGRVDIHQKLSADLSANRVPCVKCHGPPHSTSSGGRS